MNKDFKHQLIRSIAASWAGKRNLGNMSHKELAGVDMLVAKKEAEIFKNNNGTWCMLTEAGIRELYRLNGINRQEEK
ncbi:MAG: hypothetical protein CME70_18765 [Halobacteriovorax sp.]|nr:hypothetical protein [Halobacteriovorax sp.]|tara:strand:+ start:1687 stop:1917 length:231 start_codon:yes stop_codon:yes gene_type:complete